MPPEELQQLIEALAQLDVPQPAMNEEEFQAHLLKTGIISELPQPIGERQPSHFQPISVQGKPLSETIIEERR